MPALFVVTLPTAPRSTLCSFTSTPGTTAPVASVIRPEIVAVSVWPIAAQTKHNIPSTKPQANRSRRVIVIVAYPSFLVCPQRCQNSPTKAKIISNRRRVGLDNEQLRRFVLCRGTENGRLRMVRRTSEIRVQHLLAVRFAVVLVGRFSGYEDGVDLSENIWVVESHRPTVLARIIFMQNT